MKDTIWSNRGGVFHVLRPGETMRDVWARCMELRTYTPRSFPLWVIDDGELERDEYLPLVRVFVGALSEAEA